MIRYGMLSLALAVVLAACQATGQSSQSHLVIGGDGSVERLTLGGADVPLRAAMPFSIREAGDDTFAAFTYEGSDGSAHVYRAGDRYRLVVRATPVGTAMRLDGQIEAVDGRPGAFTLRFALPVDMASGAWTWEGELDDARSLSDGALHRNVVPARTASGEAGSVNSTLFGAAGDGDVGYRVGMGEMSFYPFAAIDGDANGEALGVSIGVDMDLPVVFRLQAQQDEGLIFEYDTAVSPATAKFPNRSFFRIYLFPHDPAWGLRSAAEQYYALFPERFVKRVEREGIWMPFVDVTSVEGYEDFGFAFLETGSTSRATAEREQAAGVYTFPYTEPWDTQQGRHRKGLTYASELARGMADSVLAALSTRDSRDQWMIRYMWAPWFDEEYAVSYTLNPDPELARKKGVQHDFERVVLPAVENGHSGIYFDSWEFKWMYDLNYRTEHFETADYPLTFSASLDEPRPAIWNYASEYEFGRFVADTLHAQGLLTMGNGFEWIPFTAGIMDLFGSEIDYTQPDTTRISKWHFRRTIAGTKPIVLLLNTGLYSPPFVEAPHPGYDQYFQEALFYGFHPSFFSENASDDPYWRSPYHYNIGRPFFKKYIPVIREVASAGWQPVTLARVRPANLGLERFGTGDGPVYLTLRNFSNAGPTDFEITLDLKALGWRDAAVTRLLEAEPVTASVEGTTLTLKGHIDPTTTQAYRLTKLD